MLPFMARPLLIWGETAPRGEAPRHWLAPAERPRPLAAAWRLICIRSGRARVTPGSEHAGRLLKGPRPGRSAGGAGLRSGGAGTQRRWRAGTGTAPLPPLPRARFRRQPRHAGPRRGHTTWRKERLPGRAREGLRADCPPGRQLLPRADPSPAGVTACRDSGPPVCLGVCRGTPRVRVLRGVQGTGLKQIRPKQPLLKQKLIST